MTLHAITNCSLVVVAVHVACSSLGAAEPRVLTARSPDGSNAISLAIDSEQGVRINVTRGDRPVLSASAFDVRTKEQGRLADGVQIRSLEEGTTDETFRLPWGKSAEVKNRCNWGRVRFKNRQGVEWQFDLVAYDDGVAFRYSLPKQQGLELVSIEDEACEYRFAADATMHFTALKNFTTDHEVEFRRQPIAQLPPKTLLDLPLLAVWADGSAAAITEACLRDSSSLYLERTAATDAVVLGSRLSPLPRNPRASVIARLPHQSPWRVVLLGDSAGKLLESNLLVCLNDPPPAGDYAWATPGKSTWHWWNGTAESGLPFASGMNLATHKRYIEFCARHGIRYHAVVADDRPWHVQTAKDFAPQPDTDILTPRPELELPKILDYARERGVGIRLWVHWKSLDARLEEAFQRYQDWGISGLMVDFLDRDDQEMINYCERVLESAASHKLHIQFHGSYKPSGEWRTFPHLFNREGVLNLEYLKWSKRCTPPHNVEAAYVRALAGPLDYHLGGFRSISRDKFVARNDNPYVLGTRCHHLAMYVVFDNPMPMVCDTPSAYEGQTGFEFIVDVPTNWDETRYVAGEAGEYVVIARRKGAKWYLGGMTNWTRRELKIPTGFLGDGQFEARLFVDGSTSEDEPNAIRVETKAVKAGEPLSITMAPGGGFAAVVAPK